MSRQELARGVLVLGSVASGVALMPLSKDPDGRGAAVSTYARYADMYRRYSEWIGAPTVCRMIDAALGAQPGEVAPNPCADKATLPVRAADCRELTTVLASYPVKSSSTGPSVDRVMRVQTSYFTLPSGTDEARENMRRYLESAVRGATGARIVVVYERDREFGDVFAKLVAVPTAFEPDPGRALVVSLADDISVTALSQAITFAHGRTADRGKIVAVLTAEALRHRGLNIVEYGSIERTVRDLVHYTGRDPLAKILALCGHVVIVFEDIGAIYLRRDEGDTWTGSIHYCPNFDRVAQRDAETYGKTPGRREIAVAAIVSQIDAEMTRPSGPSWNLADGVRLGLAAHNLHFKKGFDPDKDPFETFEQVLGDARRKQLRELIDGSPEKKGDTEFLLSSLRFGVNEDALKTWSRVHAVIPPSADASALRDRLREIVAQGPEQPFRERAGRTRTDPWFPGSAIKCPYFQIGKIKTADTAEIEGFANLIELFRRYLRDQDWSTPLSIGVFGPPGTGKSFAVKELMKTVNPAAKDILTYNLAQFNSVELLTEAFHQVQDRALASDEVPLVMFDEFDAKFDGTPLGWLKYFLAPMQDGVFRGRSADYRVGRAIFVFSGGTENSYDDFDKAKPRAPGSASNRSDGSPSEAEARAVKLNDFISRLKGHLNISDINPPRHRGTSFSAPESEDAKVLRMVRRAMVLRSLLEQFAKPVMQSGPEFALARIRPEVIDAFINVEQYRHGVRSMESVIRMSRWIDGYFLPTSLPARDQLDMHAPGFLDRVVEAAAGALAPPKP